jgi:hypothetical protein
MDIPFSLLEILNGIGTFLPARPPQVLDGIADVEVVPLGDGDAFHPGGMVAVVRRMIDEVRFA